MNRLQFLKMMRNSLMETVKEASAPLLEDEVEKVKTLFFSHRTWHSIGLCDDVHGVEMKTVARIPIVVYKHAGTLHVKKSDLFALSRDATLYRARSSFHLLVL
ncbi:hypothetical protein [Anoxybacillus flavithermus]|uniref:hypothetical protein n=1 Tax=Anoxybacillus flavithermus TaxID=33934 RepID=UPI001F50A9F3|nr:hypothetical protein [Anoxybacillus flavithermus]